MKEWDRSTKKLLPETIQPEIAAAIQVSEMISFTQFQGIFDVAEG